VNEAKFFFKHKIFCRKQVDRQKERKSKLTHDTQLCCRYMSRQLTTLPRKILTFFSSEKKRVRQEDSEPKETSKTSENKEYKSIYWASAQFQPHLVMSFRSRPMPASSSSSSASPSSSSFSGDEKNTEKYIQGLIERFHLVVCALLGPQPRKVFTQVWVARVATPDTDILLHFNIFFEDPPVTNLEDELKSLYARLSDGLERTHVLGYVSDTFRFPEEYYNPRFTLPADK
jgi:hypothetical protein